MGMGCILTWELLGTKEIALSLHVVILPSFHSHLPTCVL